MYLTYYLENGNSFDYEADWDEVKEAITKIFAVTYRVSETTAMDIIDDFDLYEQCEEQFKDQLKDYFSRKAYESYRDDEKYPTDADRYGVKNSWFI